MKAIEIRADMSTVVTQQELGQRLRQARLACGLTQEAVARRIGLSRPAIAQIEGGNRSVSSLELDRLAYLYGRDMGEFFAEDFGEDASVVALFRHQPDLEDAEALRDALNRVLELSRETVNLEELLGVERAAGLLPSYDEEAPRQPWEAAAQGQWAAEAERRRLGLGEGPVPDVADVLEWQGIRTAQIALPEDVSGVTLCDAKHGVFCVVNSRLPRHSVLRRRFSLAHEYCHALWDRSRGGAVSREGDRGTLVEVRANAFAAAFLMPEAGVRAFVARLGKGTGVPRRMEVYDGAETKRVEGRFRRRDREWQLDDVVVLADHYGVSRLAALYRLKNLGLLKGSRFDALLQQEEAGMGRDIEALLGLQESGRWATRVDFRRRFLRLAAEAYRQGEITLAKLRELTAMVKLSADDFARLVRILDQT